MGGSIVAAMPFVLIFTIFNGFTVTSTTAPEFVSWIIKLSPCAHAIEAVASAAENAAEGSAKIEWAMTNDVYGYDIDKVTSVLTFVLYTVAFRIGQAVCMKKLHKIQR